MASYLPFLSIVVIFGVGVVVVSGAISCPPSDRDALLAFRSALSEPYLGIFSSWTGTITITITINLSLKFSG